MNAAPCPTIDIDPASVRRILVCQLRQIGDVVLTTPSISLLRKRFPDAQIHVLTMKVNEAVLAQNPDVDKLWLIDRNAHRNIFTQFRFYLRVVQQRFDIIVDFQQLPRIRNVVALARFFKPYSERQIRLSFTPPWYNRPFYTHWCKMINGYAAKAKASVLRPLGIEWNGERPSMRFTTEERAQADATLYELGIGRHDFLVTVDPTHRRETRCWPAEYYGRLAAMAAEANPRIKFLVFHGPGEEEEVQKVEQAANSPAVIVPKRLFSIREMSTLIARANMHFGNCSAPRHIAVAVGTPTFTVLGSTSSAWTFPAPEHEHFSLGLDCQPCNDNACRLGDIRCLRNLTPERLLPEFMERVARYDREA
ncbi:heptosyltransferase-2/heptosyltransferase-3 [Desulfobaculum xiamenense]|uniref:Heptosyltransferase-2/heptosyltransferase-3 n=1 Tax=Desulfobaculum xiamenense TaxID=995050 RepID=A0A846QD26_9BACT|nr:glycosyltransferase family 9 protein [Desulfobaculum xiamenense]NJB66626.1 heptosyltransferase-2/heptosyltransferase-3 [Desulfobaculum xiamenense]